MVHPGLSMSVGFDSNVYYASQQETDQVHQSPEGVFEPNLSVAIAEPGVWELWGDAAVGWRQYLTDEERVRSQSGLSANLDLASRWNAEGTASLELSNEFVRTNETPNTASRQASNRVYNRAGATVGLHPGAGLLETYGSYDFALYRHNLFSDLDRHAHHFGWNLHWSFLPKTAFLAEVDYRAIRYDQEFRGPQVSPEGRLRNVDSDPIRVMAGLDGLVTTRVSLGLRGGYGWARYQEGPDFSGLLAQVEASYQFGDVAFDNRLRAGYERGFRDSSIGNFYTSHRFLTGYEQGFAGNRLRLELEADAQIRDYAPTGIDAAQTEDHEFLFPEALSDLLVGVSAATRMEIRKGWDVGVRYSFRSNFTEDQIVVIGPGEDVIRDYQRHHVLLSTELRY